jgi:hypothetical protein
LPNGSTVGAASTSIGRGFVGQGGEAEVQLACDVLNSLEGPSDSLRSFLNTGPALHRHGTVSSCCDPMSHIMSFLNNIST